MQFLRMLLAASLLCTVSGCPSGNGTDSNSSSAATDPPEGLNPTAAIPQQNPYLEYAGLQLGIGALDLAQVYNAPKGRGDGFTRVIEYFGDVHNHIITFDEAEGEPKRQLIVSLYRDELYIIVDNREWLETGQRDQWWNELEETYGDEYAAILPTSQWSWGDPDGVLLTFTQDNASEKLLNANVVLEHKPTREAAHNYNEWRAQQEAAKAK